MAFKLNRGKPKAQRVPLGGGVALIIRSATYAESIEAAERITPLIAALREGSDAATILAEQLGDEFVDAQWTDAALAAAAHKLALVELIVLCCESIEGELLGDDDQPIAKLDTAIAAVLVRDPLIARTLRAVIEGPLHEVLDEKKELAPSQNGAAAHQAIAADAESPARPAPVAGAG